MPKSIRIIGSGINPSTTTAVEDDVLIGKIFIDNKGNEAIGRIPDRTFAPDGVSPQTRNLDAGQTLDFDYGYYNHQFSIEANSLASQTVADAVASNILVNKTAWVNGSKIVGTMPDRAAVNSALNCGGSYTIPAGYHNGSGRITANSLASQTSATAQASHILVNKTAWVNGSKVTGIMTDRAAVNSALNCGGSYTIPAGYHNGSGRITANSLASQTSATARAGDILSGKTAWVNGSKITGSIGSLGATTYTPGTSDKTIAAGKYLSGVQTIKGDSNLKAENIKKGISILGVAGSLIGGGTITDRLSIQGYKDKMVGDYTYYTIAFNYSTTKNIVAVWYYYNSRTAFDWGIAYNIQSDGRCYIQTCRQNNPMTFDNVYNSVFSVHKNGATLCCTFDGASTYYGYLLLSD